MKIKKLKASKVWGETPGLPDQSKSFGNAGRPVRFGYNKFGNKRTKVDGYSFASKKEAQEYLNIKAFHLAGEIKEFKLQPRFKFPCGTTYVADFDVTWKDGKREIIDVKGMRTDVYKIKKKMFACHYAELTFREV